MKGAATLGKIIKKSAKKNAHSIAAALLQKFLRDGGLNEEDETEEAEAMEQIVRYHERLGG